MSTPWAHQQGDAVILSVYAQPGASRTETVGERADTLKIRLAAPPVDGKANAALIAFIAEQLDLPRSRIRLIGGALSRRKRLQVCDKALDAVVAAFRPAADRTQLP